MLATGVSFRQLATVLAIGTALLAALAFVGAPLLVDTSDFRTPAAREQARNDARTSAVQLLGVLGLAVGAVFTGLTLRLNQQGQITERFTKAIDQLGNEQATDVRIGGLHALARVARESAEDHPAIVEVVSAFLQKRTSWSDGRGTGPGPDVQAAVSILGRRKVEHDATRRLDLSLLDLRGLDLADAELAFARMAGSHLEGADLRRANLNWAKLSHAHLEGAQLGGGPVRSLELSGAEAAGIVVYTLSASSLWVIEAQLQGASIMHLETEKVYGRELALDGALLLDCTLRDAELKNASFAGASLTDVNLPGADLSGALLRGARLTRVDLTGADLTGADLTGVSHTDVRWPASFEPASIEAMSPPTAADLLAGYDGRGYSLLYTDGLAEKRLPHPRLSGTQLESALVQADVRGGDLRGAHGRYRPFTEANLIGADLRGAQLAGATFPGAYLTDADLRGAELKEARFEDANLDGANLWGARYDASTTWPPGLDPRERGAIFAA